MPETATAALGLTAEAGRADASLEDDGRVRTHECRNTRRVPVGEPYAAMRLRVADPRRLRGSMQAVVLDAQIDPDDADRIVRSRFDRRLGVGSLCVPEQVRVVVKLRRPGDRTNMPVPDRKRIVAAAARDGRE